MSRENLDIVRRAYEAWNSEEPEAAIAFLAPDVEWHLPENFPDAGTWRGREQVVEGLRSTSASWDRLDAEVERLIDAGDRVVALVRYHGRAAVTGLDLDSRDLDATVWTLRDGRAVDVRMYNGTDTALAEVGLEE